MNTFFIEFRDPLFGIIIFFLLIFIIAFLSYWWGKYRSKKDFKNLNKFLKQFKLLPSKSEINILISGSEISQKSWMLLAQSYFKEGSYEKCIDIYKELLNLDNVDNQNEIFFLLGRTYLKAGFLERSKNIFMEILRKNPRTIETLEELLLVYENMKDYDGSLEVLDILETLNQDISSASMYIKYNALLNDSSIDPKKKSLEIMQMYLQSYKLPYLVFEYVFKVNPKLAWSNYDSSLSEILTDILWRLNKEFLNLETIEKDSYLRELYSARGDVSFSKSSDIFEFDILIKLGNASNATFSFQYICKFCKHTSPFVFHRCRTCSALGSIGTEISLVKKQSRAYEEDNSFL